MWCAARRAHSVILCGTRTFSGGMLASEEEEAARLARAVMKGEMKALAGLWQLLRRTNAAAGEPPLLSPSDCRVCPEVRACWDAAFPDVEGNRASAVERLAAMSAGSGRDHLTLDNMTHGEIGFDAMQQLLARLRHYGFAASRPGAMFDLGSGNGRPVIASAVLEPGFNRCVGVEVLGELHRSSLSAATRLREHQQRRPGETLSTVEFELGDFMAPRLLARWAGPDTALLLIHGTCFSPQLMQRIAAAAESGLPAGAFVASVSKPLPSATFQTLERCKVDLSWGSATVVLQQRLCVAEGRPGGANPLTAQHTAELAAIGAEGLLPRLVELLAHPGAHAGAAAGGHNGMVANAACAVAFAAADEVSARVLVDAGAADALLALLASDGGGSSNALPPPPVTAAALLAIDALAQHHGTVPALVGEDGHGIRRLLGVFCNGAGSLPQPLHDALTTSLCTVISLDVRAQDALKDAPDKVVGLLRQLAADPLAATGVQQAAQDALTACELR